MTFGIWVLAWRPSSGPDRWREDRTRLVIEGASEPQVLRFAGEGVEGREHVVHAAELHAEGGLHLLGRQAIDSEGDPVGHGHEHVTSPGTAGEAVGIEEARHDLVQRVPRRPHRLSRLDAIDERLREGGQVARVVPGLRGRTLAVGEAIYHRVDALLEGGITGASIHERAGGQVVAGGVASQLDAG
jgi:hypothetical protein